jgi:hypothetical protein
MKIDAASLAAIYSDQTPCSLEATADQRFRTRLTAGLLLNSAPNKKGTKSSKLRKGLLFSM